MIPIAQILLPLAARAGAPLIERLLSKAIGRNAAGLVADVVGTVAAQAGVTPEELPAKIQADPDAVEKALVEAEVEAPELLAVYAAGLEGQFSLLKREMREPLWTWAWRPAGMWGLGALWFWNVVLLHVVNAVFKIALPQMDLGDLFNLTALFLGLYMGGHTLKDVAGKVAPGLKGLRLKGLS